MDHFPSDEWLSFRAMPPDRFFLLTHPHVIEYARTRWEEVDAAFAEQAPRYEGDDRYDVTKAIARIRAQRAG